VVPVLAAAADPAEETLLPPEVATAPELSAEEIATIKEEVAAAMQRYLDFYIEHDMHSVAQKVYNTPFVGVGPEGLWFQATREDIEKRHKKHLKELVDTGWVRTIFPDPEICVLNSRAAVLSGAITRFREDGSVHSTNGVTYFFGKAPDGWRIMLFTNQHPDKVATCND
jgi:hypothetical protein